MFVRTKWAWIAGAALIGVALVWFTRKPTTPTSTVIAEQATLEPGGDSIRVLLLPMSVLRDDPHADIRFMEALKLRIERDAQLMRMPLSVMVQSSGAQAVATVEQAADRAKKASAQLAFYGELHEPTNADSGRVDLNFVIIGEGGNGTIALHTFSSLFDSSAAAIMDEAVAMVHFVVGHDYIMRNRVSHALALLNSTTTNTEYGTITLEYFKAKCYMELKDTLHTLIAAERMIAVNPNDPQSHASKAAYLKAFGDLVGAQRHYERALALQPDMPYALSELGEVVSRRFGTSAHGAPRAKELVLRSLELDSTSAYAWGLLASLERDLHEYDSAFAHLNRCLRIDPLNHQARLDRAELFAFYYRQPEKAVTELAEMVRLDSLDSRAMLMLARIYTDTPLKDAAKADALLRRSRAETRGDRYRMHFGKAKNADNVRDHGTALHEALEAWRIDSTNADLGLLLASQYSQLHKYDQAADLLYRLLARDSFDFSVAYNAAHFHWKGPKEFRDLKKAANHMSRSLTTDPANVYVLNDLGQIYFEMGQWSNSEWALNKVLASVPDHGEAHATLATIMGKSGREVEAIEHFTKALEKTPDDELLNFNMAVTLVKMDQRNAPFSLAHATKALKANPSAINELLVAQMLLLTGAYEKSAEHYRAAIRKDPTIRSNDPTLEAELKKKGYW